MILRCGKPYTCPHLGEGVSALWQMKEVEHYVASLRNDSDVHKATCGISGKSVKKQRERLCKCNF